MKVFLVCNTSFFGDTILTDALCRNIKFQYRDSKIVFVVNKPFFEVARYMEGVDETWAYDKNGEHKGLIGLYRFYKQYKNRYNFDASFVIYGNERNILLSKLLGCKRVFADNEGILRFLVDNGSIDYSNKIHAQDRFSALLEEYSNQPIDELKIKYNPPAQAYEFVENLKTQLAINDLNNVVLINPTSKAKERDLRLDTCVDLLKELNDLNKTPAIVGAGSSASKYIESLEQTGCKNFINLVDKTSFSQLGALLEKSCALISVDTGTLHLALALNVPVVAIFYINTELKIKRWAPKAMYNHRLIADGDYSAKNIIRAFKELKEIL